MERRIRKIVVFILFSLFIFSIKAQTFSSLERIHIPLWADLEAFPGSKTSKQVSASFFDYAIGQLKDIGPMLITGMVYGWYFSYTPSDKTRAVKESFEFKPIKEINVKKNKIYYRKPWVQDDSLYAWVDFERTPSMIAYYQSWKSIKNPNIKGSGSGDVYKGFKGIQEASEKAVKDAVRTYFRKIIKNKPKKIEGRVIINSEPNLMIKSGQYHIQLDFFLQTDRILAYTQF